MKFFRNAIAVLKLALSLIPVHKYRWLIRGYRKAKNLGFERDEILNATSRWGRDCCKKLDIKVTAEGLENLPDSGPVVIAANHQSNFDVMALCSVLTKFQFGFVSKKELERVPIYGAWIKDIRGVFIDRSSAREALASMKQCEDYLRQGFSMMIFPEGTRSKGPEIGEFKKGSLKMAVKAKVPIIPIAVEGGYHGLEEKGYWQPCEIKIKILPPVETAELSRNEGAEIAATIESLIREAHAEL